MHKFFQVSHHTLTAVKRHPMPAIVWLHGLGDSGRGWSHLKGELGLKGVQYTFPDAPVNPVSCNGGYEMTSWMDLENIPVALGDKNDLKGVTASAALVHAALDAVVAKMPSTEVVLGGFSQGGAMALFAGYSYSKPLGGIVSFSGWSPLTKTDEATFISDLKAGANAQTPCFIGHGSEDNVVLPECGERAAKALEEAGVKDVSYSTYRMAHSSHPAETDALAKWVSEKLKLS